MSRKNSQRRVLIAVTETSPVAELWQAAVEQVNHLQATEVVAVFVSDDRWRRAASLPFTREVSRASGASVDFTRQRAEQVDDDTVRRKRRQIRRLAAESNLSAAFETLSEFDTLRIEELVGAGENLLIAPSLLRLRPIYAELARLECRIVFVETAERAPPRRQ